MIGWTIEVSFVMGIASLLVYLFFFRKGQFNRSEETKYMVFREEDTDA